MKRLLCTAILLAMVVPIGSCKPPAPGKVSPTGPSSGQPLAQAESHTVDIGDVESSLRMDTLLADESKTANVTVDEMVNPKGILDLLTIDLTPPHPQQLYLNVVVKATANFTEAPVVMRVTLQRDNQKIGQFEKVWGANAVGEPWITKVDVLQGLASAPASMLIHAQAEVFLLPAGTDEASVDPKTAVGKADSTGAVLGNPVRINFTSGGTSQ